MIIAKHLFAIVGALAVTLVAVAPGSGDPVQVPHSIGGFTLGAGIDQYRSKLDMDSCRCIQYIAYLEEVEILPLKGFKSGLIAYGVCAAPKKIVRIKLKYANPSKRFYEALLKRYKQRFGEPSEYRGDPFHILVAWKWSFVDIDNNRISLTLQHNTRDEEEKMGNAVKLTMTSRVEAEQACFEEKTGKRQPALPQNQSGKPDWDLFIPR